MFCSLCKNVDDIRECQRKICPVGHVFCESCGESRNICPECSMKFSNFVCVQITNKVPRLFILEESSGNNSESVTPEKKEDKSENLLESSDSFQRIINELRVYDGSYLEQDEVPKRVLSYFDDDEERKILNNYGISNKASVDDDRKVYSDKPLEKQLNSSSEKPHFGKSDWHHCKPQASETCVVENGAGDSILTHPPSSLKALTSKYTNSSYNHHANETFDVHSIIESCDDASLLEIFINNRHLDESETAHFTSLTVNKTIPTPPDLSPRKRITSIASRSKYSVFYDVDESIPAQMEPIIVYELDSSESSESSDGLPADMAKRLPRFPVQCPITNCDSWGVPSDFCNHITIDHPCVDVFKVQPGNLINIKLNLKGNANMVTCQRLFLVSDKIKDIGYGSFENCLPITLLTTKMSLSKTFGFSINDENICDEIFYIFLVGVYQFPIDYTLTVWVHGRDDSEPTMIKCMSNSVFFMNRPFIPKEVAGNAIGVSRLELQKLTRDGSKMLSCQIIIH